MNKYSLFFLLVIIISGCVTHKKHESPPVKLPRKFSLSGVKKLESKWWQTFKDPFLNSLIEKALENNLSFLKMWDRLNQAKAAAKKADTDLYPTASGSVGYRRTETMGKDAKAGTNYFSFGPSISYELDLWGRIKSTHDAALLDYDASIYDMEAAAITLVSNIIETWFQIIEQNIELRIIEKQIEINKKNLELISLKYRQGIVPIIDILQQKQTLEGNNADKIKIERNLEVYKNSLAILCGLPPKELKVPESDKLPNMSELPDTGSVNDWVQRRPDLKKAYTDVLAADKRVAAAIGNLYPKLGLSVELNTTASELRDWFSNWAAALAANLVAPIFEAGERLEEIERTKAVASEKFHTYGDSLLTAMKEVEDALISEVKQKEYIKSLEYQYKLSSQTIEQTRDRYIYGEEDFLRYLSVLLSHQKLELSLAQARRQLISYRIDLYKSIGGAWNIKTPKIFMKKDEE